MARIWVTLNSFCKMGIRAWQHNTLPLCPGHVYYRSFLSVRWVLGILRSELNSQSCKGQFRLGLRHVEQGNLAFLLVPFSQHGLRQPLFVLIGFMQVYPLGQTLALWSGKWAVWDDLNPLSLCVTVPTQFRSLHIWEFWPKHGTSSTYLMDRTHGEHEDVVVRAWDRPTSKGCEDNCF